MACQVSAKSSGQSGTRHLVFAKYEFLLYIKTFAGISVQPLVNSLSTTMERFTIISPSSARMTRPGLQQLFPTNASVSCPNVFFAKRNLLLGSKCVRPPQPDAAHKMIVSWNPDYPPAHNEKITYKCDAGQPYNRQDLYRKCGT